MTTTHDISVPFLDLLPGYHELRPALDAAYSRVMTSGRYLLGPETEEFERQFAGYVGATDCATVGSGLDALALSMRALGVGPGDEVIVPTNTFIATWLAVTQVGATPVPVEPAPGSYSIDADGIAAAYTTRTAAVIPVHLYGLPCPVDEIDQIASELGIAVLYDAAQAHGAQVSGRPVGGSGRLSAWSFYPGKNAGAFGDGGAVTSSDAALIASIKRLRNYGSSIRYVHDELGTNSRLDELQAALLTVKLAALDEWNSRRSAIAQRYLRDLAELELELPPTDPRWSPTWHLFAIQIDDRDEVQTRLGKAGVQTLIHYPIPPHRQRAYENTYPAQPIAERMSERLLSLPIGPHMTSDMAGLVVDALRSAIHARS